MSLRRNTLYNLAGAAVPLAVTVATLPRYIAAIGEARYGVLAILWTLLGYFGLFDLGIGRAVTNRIAALRAAPAAEREEVFWTALAINAGLGILGALLLWGGGALILEHLVKAPGSLALEVERALPWMVLAFPLILLSGVCTGALQGREEFLAQNVISVAGAVLAQIVPLVVALRLGPALPNLVISLMAVRAASGVGLFAACRARLPARSRPRLVRAHVRPLFSYGGWITVTSVVAPLLTTLDRVIIGALVGAQAVTYYVVPFNLATRVTILPGALSGALFPRLSGQDDADARHLLFRSTWLLVVAMLPPILLGLWLMQPFLTWWMGAEFASRAARTGQWIVLGLWMNVFAYPAYTSIPARGRPDLVAKLQLVQAVPYLLLLWWALTRYGVAGGAAVWALRNTADAAALILLARVDRRIWPLIAQSAGFLALAALVTFGARPLSAASFVGIAGVLTLSALWAWHAEPGLFAGGWSSAVGRRLSVNRTGPTTGSR